MANKVKVTLFRSPISTLPKHKLCVKGLGLRRIGQTVEVELDAFPGQPLEGVVDSFSPATGAKFALLPPENATGNFTKIVQRVPVKITIPDQQELKGRLLPGLSVVATIDKRG